MTGMPCCCDTPPPEECCAALTLLAGWTSISSCCIRRVVELEGELLHTFCSDLIHHDVRSASAKYRAKTRPYPQFCFYPGELECSIGLPDVVDCFYNGIPLPKCDLDEELCTLIEEIHNREYKERLLVRYERIQRIDTIEVVLNQCGDEETPTCKYLWSTAYRYKVEYGQVGFLDVLHTLIGASDCCSDFNEDSSVTAPACDTYVIATPLANTIYVDLVRTKAFAVQPTGTVSLAPGDTVTCSPSPTCAMVGSDTFTINTTDFGLIAWTAPVCSETTTHPRCHILAICEDFSKAPPRTSCALYESPETDSLTTLIQSHITGMLLAVPSIAYTCTDVCGDDPATALPYDYLSSVKCEDLVSSHTEIAYTARPYTLQDATTWTITV